MAPIAVAGCLLLGCWPKPGCTADASVACLPLWNLDGAVALNGGADHPADLARIAGLVSSRSGLILVSDAERPRLLLLDSTGNLIRDVSADRRIEQELVRPGVPSLLHGDTVAVLDPIGARVLLFGPDMSYLGVRLLDRYQSGAVAAFPLAALAPGAALSGLVPTGPRFLSRGEVVRDAAIFGTVVSGGAGFDTLFVGRGFELVGLGGGAVAAVRFGPSSIAAVGPGPRVWAGDTDSSVVFHIDPSTGARRVVRWADEPDSVTAADSARGVQADLAEWRQLVDGSGEQSQLKVEPALRQRPGRRTMPRFTGIVPTYDGGAWIVRRARPWSATSEHLAVDAAGRVVARIAAPSRFRPLAVSGAWVLGTIPAGPAAEIAVRYHLARPE
ncbi:MAG: hypothetical protein AB7L66_16185 [Gemmatimonadales bacterium]